jgi:hypothetical protein
MAWIESHQALGQHPKTIALAEELHCSLATAVGHLHYLWWWALDYAQDGVVRTRAQAPASRASQWRGKPEVFWQALVATGFADVVDQECQTMAIHDWSEYAGRLIGVRNKDAERKREWRRSAGRPGPATRTSASRPAYTTNPTQPTGPNQPDTTQPDPTQPEKTAGRQRAHAPAREADPKLLAEHLQLIARDRASRGQPSQPASKHSLNGETDDAER